LSERRSCWSEISGFSHHNTLQPDEPELLISLETISSTLTEVTTG